MATRTAPTVDGSPTFKVVSITYYDYTGEQRSDSYQVDAAATEAQIEALVAALQAATNGTIWRVRVQDVYNSVGDSSNADEAVWEEITSNLVILAKNAANDSYDWYIPAPTNDMFIEGTEQIDPSSTLLAAVMTALLALKSGFSVVSARFTSRRDVGTKVNI